MTSSTRLKKSSSPSELVFQSSFRLWLTILPTNTFPASLLQMSVVVSSEPPNGLRAGLLGCYTKDGPATDFFHDIGHEHWPKFLFAICFLHISVCQRREYGQFGWSFPYAFGKADLSASLMYSRTLFDASDPSCGIDWISVSFVVCEILYGGLITADSDRDIVSALGRSLLDGRIYTNGYNIAPGLLIPGGRVAHNQYLGRGRGRKSQRKSNSTKSTNSISRAVTVADAIASEVEEINLSTFVNYAAALPTNDHPEWYGLHENAAFSSLHESGALLLGTSGNAFPTSKVVRSKHRHRIGIAQCLMKTEFWH